jgi:3-oxoacyl-[acyl-carrier protein] reductase
MKADCLSRGEMSRERAGTPHIHVNAVSPRIETEGIGSLRIIESDFQKQVEAQMPLGRIGQRKDVAGPESSSPPRLSTG